MVRMTEEKGKGICHLGGKHQALTTWKMIKLILSLLGDFLAKTPALSPPHLLCDCSEVSLSGTDMKIKLMELAAPAAHRDRGDTQQSREGKENEGRCSGLSMSRLDLSHHPDSNHSDLKPTPLQPPTWPPSFQTCSRSPLQSTLQMRPLP